MLLILLAAGLWAGVQNALAGGGSFVTLPALILAGLDPKAANITSTVALFPGQISTGIAGRHDVQGTPALSFRALLAITVLGGVAGAFLLLATSAAAFGALVPWLVLFATALFAWGSFGPKPAEGARAMGPVGAAAAQFASGGYGGYFGGGNGFVMLAILTAAGLQLRRAGATKNVLVSVTNTAAVVVFLFTAPIAWTQALVLGAGSLAGGLAGAWFLKRVDERLLRVVIVGIGLALSAGLFWRAYG